MTQETLGPSLLDRLPAAVQRPGYDRAALRAGMAHIGVGAFHRAHQAEYTDDLLARSFDRWGVVGINLRPPELAATLGRQHGLYTRLCRSGDSAEARVIGSILRTVDSQHGPEPALAVLADPAIDVVTLTVTEKAYCHRPADGALDPGHPDILHDRAHPDAPRSLPGLVLAALDRRRLTDAGPVTLISCDNIPGNGAILAAVVRALAADRPALADWIAANAAFPSTMVDRIAPATTEADRATVAERFGYRDAAVAVGEPFRQWVIEDRFAGRRPPWDLAGATFAADVTPYEHLKMRILNGAQTTLASLGVLAGHEHTFDAVADPLLLAFTERMLVRESLPTLAPVPGMDATAYVAQSLDRLRNTAIRHRCHQIATDGSQKIVQRLLNPAAERLRRGEPVRYLPVAVAACLAYLIRAAPGFGAAWTADDPEAARIAALADRIGRDPQALTTAILAIDAIFPPALAADPGFSAAVADALDGFLSPDPMAPLRRLLAPSPLDTRP